MDLHYDNLWFICVDSLQASNNPLNSWSFTSGNPELDDEPICIAITAFLLGYLLTNPLSFFVWQ